MRSKKDILGRKRERGVVITLVAVFMLGVIAAMAALSIDVVTLYTARSEAQLTADAAALAGARVLANSGMTSSSGTTLGDNAKPFAIAVATQVAASSMVGGRTLNAGAATCTAEICVKIPAGVANFIPNPQVTVQVQRTDLPTFFARIWGTTQVAVAASATAEAYNPSSLYGTRPSPVAPVCVKPWLVPNIDPINNAVQIFDPATGQIKDTSLLGWQTPTTPTVATQLFSDCGTTACSSANGPAVWKYYPGTTDPTGDFPAPPSTSVTCAGCSSSFQYSIAGCEQKPVQCNQLVSIDIVTTGQDAQSQVAVDALIHDTSNGADQVDGLVITPPTGNAPFRFLAGAENPLVLAAGEAAGTVTMLSDSLVTVPVIDATWPPPNGFPKVQVIGFVQIFLSPNGAAPTSGQMSTQVINLVGCGTPASGGATGNPILGNGASPVAVRLICNNSNCPSS